MSPRRRTIVLGTATVLLGIAALFVAAVVTLTQTDRGRALILSLAIPSLRAAIPGQLYVGRIGGTLFTDITIDSLEIRDPDGKPFVRTGPIRLSYDPRDIYDRRIVVKSLEVTRPHVTLVDYGADDWNWKRALRRKGPKLPTPRTGFGDYIVIDTTTLREVTVVMRQPWTLSDTLKGAKRDSALKFNLTRLDGEIRREVERPGRFQRVWRFERGELALGRTRLADADSAGQAFEVRKLDVVWVYPPFWFRNMRGTVRILGDSLWMDGAQFQLAKSSGRGDAKLVWGGGKPMRYDVRIHGDTVAMSDVAWIDETLPHTGGGSTDLTIRNDPKNLSIMEYTLTNMDARSLRSRLTGRMTFGVGGEMLRVTDVALDLKPAHTDLLRWLNAEPFPYDWQGALSGRVIARGGPVTMFRIDEANLTYDDAHVPGAQSRFFATGTADIFTPAEAILKGVDLRIDQLDLRTPRYVNPLFVELNGIVRGTTRLDSLWYDVRFSQADMEHIDGPGEPSRVTGSGRLTLVEQGTKFDVDVQVAPLSYTTMSRSYPGLPLRGTAVGRIQAKGLAEDFQMEMTVAGEGGELSYIGHMDAFEPEYAATGSFRVRSGNLQALFGDSRFPRSNLSLLGEVDMIGATLSSLRGPIRATIDQFSRIADVRVFGGSASVVFDSGVVRVDTLMMESSAARLTARGALALVAERSDSLQFTVAIDSLGGLRPWLQSGDSSTRLVNPGDTLRGTIEIRGQLAGTIDTLDRTGLALDARADASGLVFGRSRAARANVALNVSDVMRGGNGLLQLTLDSARTAGIDIASGAGRSTVRHGLADRFALELSTPSEARVAMTGGVTREADTTRVLLDTLSIRVDSGATRPRGFRLVAPAVLRMVGRQGTGALDSLVLAHSDTGRLSVRGAIGDSGALAGRLDVDRVPLADVGRLMMSSGLNGGTATASAIVSGTKEQPRLEATVSLRDALAGGMRLSELDASVRYDSLRLSVDGSLGVGGRPALSVTASLPVDLALVEGRSRQRDEPLSGRIFSDRADLSLLESLFPDVTRARGRFSTDVQLAGTWEKPRFRGQLQLDSAALSLENLGIRLERATADIGIADDTVFIRRFYAISGARSDSLGVTGTISLVEPRNPYFNVRLTANNFLAIDKARTATILLTTTTPITLVGDTESARVRGAVRIDQGKVYIQALAQRRALDLTDNFDVVDTTFLGFNALLPNAPTALMQNLVLDNVRVNIGDDVWLRSPEANLKLGGSLRVTRSAGRDGGAPRLALSDSLVVERGTYQLNLGIARPGFGVERGVVRFYGDPDLEPALDITALHTVRETRANSNRQDVRIRVSIGGTLDRPSLSLSSADNPPLPESDMLSYLVTGEPAYALLGTAYAEQGATLALRLAGSYLSSRLAGGRFDVVQVEPTAIAPNEAANLRTSGLGILASTRVGLGGQVARNTYFTFTTGLCGIAQQPSGGGEALSLFAQGIGVKLERRFDSGFSASVGLEPASSAQACGRPGISRTFQQTPPQIGADFFRVWTF